MLMLIQKDCRARAPGNLFFEICILLELLVDGVFLDSFTIDDNATVLVIIFKWLNAVALIVNANAVTVNAIATNQVLLKLLCTFLRIGHVDT